MLIVRVIQFIVGVFCATAMFWAGIWYEHRPAHWPEYTWQGPLGLHWTFGLPESLAAQRDDARAAVRTLTASVATLEAAIAKQNAALQALGSSSAAAIAQAERSAQAYHAWATPTHTALAAAGAPLAAGTDCARYAQANTQFSEALRGLER